MTRFAILAALLSAVALPTSSVLPTSSALPASSALPTRIEVADRVFLYRTPPYGEVGLDGNAIAILSDDGVLVFDTNGTPAAAAAVLADIRTLTTQPVRFVVNSHWHWDHWYGTEVYKDAFPGVSIIAHEKTRMMMAGPAIEFNRPGLDTQLPAYLDAVGRRLTAAEAATPPSADAPRLKLALEAGQSFLEQKRSVRTTLPNMTYSDRLTINLGGRALLAGGADAKARGLDPDAAREALMPGLHDLMVQITGDNPRVNQAFTIQLVDWFLHRVYDELNGPLDDTIAPIPPK